MQRKARNRWERSAQVLNWLRKDFDLPGSPLIEVADSVDGDESFGEIKARGDRFVIRLSRRLCTTIHLAVEVTIHEAAHVRLYSKGLGHFHGPAFWQTYGEMMDAFNNYGHQDSRAYPTE